LYAFSSIHKQTAGRGKGTALNIMNISIRSRAGKAIDQFFTSVPYHIILFTFATIAGQTERNAFN
jgi:hypothetical protein